MSTFADLVSDIVQLRFQSGKQNVVHQIKTIYVVLESISDVSKEESSGK